MKPDFLYARYLRAVHFPSSSLLLAFLLGCSAAGCR